MADKHLSVKLKTYFSAAANRLPLNSGEEIQTTIAKIAKWLGDLKTVAFTGSYADLTNKDMTGYTKPASTSAIATTDTINQAFGKLEKGLDDVNATIGDINTILEEVL